MHDYLRTVITAPMTSGSQPVAFRLALNFHGRLGLVLLDQVRTLDKIRLVKRLDAVEAATLQKVLTTLQSMFASA